MKEIHSDVVIKVGKYLSQLREHIGSYGHAWVEGELSEFTARRGHWYFTLADESSSLKCVMWQSRTQSVSFQPQPGQLLRLYGAPTIYPKYCRLQFDVRKIERRQTIGELQKRFFELQEKLASKGLFDPSNKLKLPAIPECIGIVTSAEGAAVQDILRILRDRFPVCQLILASVRVQGPDAAPEISHAIRQFNGLSTKYQPDLLIIGRGGGSLEDLWAFNEEIVAYAISDSGIPIISAVGHETDTTIADLTADIRAATPSHAAQMAVPELSSVSQSIHWHEQHMYTAMVDRIMSMRQSINKITNSYSFNTPINHVRDAQQTLNALIDQLHEACNVRLTSQIHKVSLLNQQMVSLDPKRFLSRGYARIEHEGETVRLTEQLNTNDAIKIHFADGHRKAIVSD
ncbi:MAG: exodeoxyribonuclease VII large subunit [Bacteroidetes bacterium]|nr:exodeoxyribonuclease VII large subunit [Bacteroidota bacterium]